MTRAEQLGLRFDGASVALLRQVDKNIRTMGKGFLLVTEYRLGAMPLLRFSTINVGGVSHDSLKTRAGWRRRCRSGADQLTAARRSAGYARAFQTVFGARRERHQTSHYPRLGFSNVLNLYHPPTAVAPASLLLSGSEPCQRVPND